MLLNQIKASLAFGIGLILLGSALIRWHFVAWRAHRSDAGIDDRERNHYRTQFRRRLQVSGLLILLGFMIPLGDALMELRRAPVFLAWYWFAVLIVTFWLMLLAAFDWVSTRMHNRAMRATLASLARQERELMAEAERLRGRGSNGRH
jgi:hypothetical protein